MKVEYTRLYTELTPPQLPLQTINEDLKIKSLNLAQISREQASILSSTKSCPAPSNKFAEWLENTYRTNHPGRNIKLG